MLVIIAKTYDELSNEAARVVTNAVKQKPNLVLGLPQPVRQLECTNASSGCIGVLSSIVRGS
jgi:hypothetical protein